LKWNEETTVGSDLEALPIEDKEKWLQNMFPVVSTLDITHILKRCKGTVSESIDELLNLSFLNQDYEEDGIVQSPIPKGIDGFVESGHGTGRKGRGKKKQQQQNKNSSRTSSTGSYMSDSHVSMSNVWTTSAEDVEFICSRTALRPQVVRSEYHANGAHLSATIRSFARKSGVEYSTQKDLDPTIQLQIAEFRQAFDVPETQIYGLLTLARNIPSAAEELIATMVKVEDAETVRPGKLHGIAQYAPVDLQKENQPFEPVASASSSWNTVSQGNARTLAAAHGLAASHAFGQASSAYRRGKSDHLMGGAAAYYSQVGHERLKVAKELSAASASAHVAAQSSGTVIDLHGVSVADAVRIAEARTKAWWDGLGDAKYASGGGGPARAGFRIVTGIGSHSKNHSPRIGPAVGRMLVREGWKVEAGHGEFIVYGKARR